MCYLCEYYQYDDNIRKWFERLGCPLGKGLDRVVFPYGDDAVLKVDIWPTSSNLTEMGLWLEFKDTEYGQYLMPILEMRDDNTLVMERAVRMAKDEWGLTLPAYRDFFEQHPDLERAANHMGISDNGLHNIGLRKSGEYAIIDYAWARGSPVYDPDFVGTHHDSTVPSVFQKYGDLVTL